jgi:hypothetical protein
MEFLTQLFPELHDGHFSSESEDDRPLNEPSTPMESHQEWASKTNFHLVSVGQSSLQHEASTSAAIRPQESKENQLGSRKSISKITTSMSLPLHKLYLECTELLTQESEGKEK